MVHWRGSGPPGNEHYLDVQGPAQEMGTKGSEEAETHGDSHDHCENPASFAHRHWAPRFVTPGLS